MFQYICIFVINCRNVLFVAAHSFTAGSQGLTGISQMTKNVSIFLATNRIIESGKEICKRKLKGSV